MPDRNPTTPNIWLLYTYHNIPSALWFHKLTPQSTHRMAKATFWCTFHHDGKNSPACWGWGARWEGRYTPPISPLPLYVLCGWHPHTHTPHTIAHTHTHTHTHTHPHTHTQINIMIIWEHLTISLRSCPCFQYGGITGQAGRQAGRYISQVGSQEGSQAGRQAGRRGQDIELEFKYLLLKFWTSCSKHVLWCHKLLFNIRLHVIHTWTCPKRFS